MEQFTQKIVFGGGCFWCTEAILQKLKGVQEVISGYAGGDTKDPTYEQVSMGNTGHAEVIQVTYDTSIITLADLLAVFFSSHDPTTLNQQGADVGTQYRSIILYTTEEQKKASEDFIAKLTQEKTFENPIVTTVESLTQFYLAEENHRNYYKNNQENPYCQAVINPKITKLRKQYSHLLVD